MCLVTPRCFPCVLNHTAAPQYDGLEKIYKKYTARGLVVVGFPANDYGSQEKGDNKQIAQFANLTSALAFQCIKNFRRLFRAHPCF